MIIQGDCIEVLKTLDPESVDCVVTDPPAGISFMNKNWDSDKGGRDNWIAWMQEIAAECLRVLKPGAHAFVWALPRTSHWTATAWENAGFEVRERIAHCFGSGFPKSLDVGKAVSKLNGEVREVAGKKQFADGTFQRATARAGIYSEEKGQAINTKGTSEFEGHGTALKPAVEDWWLLRKPLSEKTVALNCLKHGCGALDIDGSRIESEGTHGSARSAGMGAGYDAHNKHGRKYGDGLGGIISQPHPSGRWPANLILQADCPEVLACFPESSVTGNRLFKNRVQQEPVTTPFTRGQAAPEYTDSGSAARFFKQIEITDDDRRIFYCAKPSKAERNMGCHKIEAKFAPTMGNGIGVKEHGPETATPKQNFHPTLKPLALMKYLIGLISRPGQTVLDPFAGSGTTGCACIELKRNYILIEKEPDYIQIIKARITKASEQGRLF